MFRNVASQKIALFAFTLSTGAAKTGDGANLTAYVSKDHGSVTVLTDTSATEMDATNAPGWYSFDLTQGETDGNELLFTAKSATGGVSVVGRPLSTLPTLGIPTAIENADALLKRDWTSVTGEAARSVLNALRRLRNRWYVSGTTGHVTKEDDSTDAWTSTLTTDAAAEPITGEDPS